MASKKNVTIKIDSDVEDAKKGINKVTESLNKLAKDVSKNPVTKLSKSVTMLGCAFSVAKNAISAVTGAISDTVEASNKQAAAEKQLEAAAKNNPYLSDYSVQQLKDYAGQLQSISTTGDEELLPMMSQLAAAGRTQAEIQDIMAASLDISASGAMSLETAVKQLNATYSGSAGRLGQMNGAVKALTSEQLKNGEAVSIMKEQYSGIAKTVSDTTGGWQKFKNSFGDFKEVLGSGFAAIQNTTGKILSNFFDTVTSKLKSAGNEADVFKKKLGIIATLEDDSAGVKDLESTVNSLSDTIKRQEDILKAVSDGQQAYTNEIKAQAKESEKSYKKEWEALNARKTAAEIALNSTIRNGELKKEQIAQETILTQNYEEQARVFEEVATETAEATEKYKAAEIALENYESTGWARVAELKEQAKDTKAAYNDMNKEFENLYSGSKTYLAKQIADNKEILRQAQERLEVAKAQEAAENNTTAIQATNKLIDENKKKLDEQVEKINQKYELQKAEGQSVDELARKQEILNAKESSYLELINLDVESQATLNEAAQRRLNDLKNDYNAVAEALKKSTDKKALEDFYKKIEDLEAKTREVLSEVDNTSLSGQLGNAILKTMELRDATEQDTEAWQRYNEKIAELSGLLDEVKAKEAEVGNTEQTDNRVQQWAKEHEKKFEIATQFVDKYSEIMSGISDLMIQNAENEATAKQAALDEQLENGEISEEEYAEKKEQIEKETAEKEYKAQMWAWSANLLNIQAQTALAVVKALAEGGPYAGPAMAALIGILGGVQLATAIANKPVPPSFATGGVVGGFQGASMGGDNTYIHARTGEMILNAAQQKAMWNTLNGGGQGGGVNMNVKVINNASNKVQAKTSMSVEGLRVVIDELVNSSMSQGRYNDSMGTAQAQQEGVRLL